MKNAFAILLLLVCVKTGLAQELVYDTTGTWNVTDESKLPDKQLADWKSIKNAWVANEYDKVKFDNKVTLNCKTCNSFYADVVIKINGAGKMEYYKVVGGKCCGRGLTKSQEVQIMRMFFKFEFPGTLRNATFRTRLGSILKC